MGKNEFHGVNLISIPVKIIRDQLLNIPITSFSKQEAIWHYNLTFSKISVSKILQKQSKRKKTNISVHYCQNLILFIVGPPPPPLLNKGVGPSKNWVTWVVPKILLERGNNPEKRGEGVDVETGGLPLFYYFTVQFHLLCVSRTVRLPLLHFGSSVFWVNHARFPSKSL